MPEIRDEQSKQEDFPDAEIRGAAQNEGFVEGEEEVQVCELGEHDVGREGDGVGDGVGGGGHVGQQQIVVWLEEGVVGSG
ncbi:hypothetical protein BPOR_0092g00100 [Botrytis porri]|uniref:Uncharacterized protein n=1 Tax=Botrytis porri TaxID=87229 RepID=A0A4Z1KZ63_9HELO|nr:hypothetical protein BPOR_0092g00100 [Botrytis porri]